MAKNKLVVQSPANYKVYMKQKLLTAAKKQLVCHKINTVIRYC
jgi:hypothetical protein